MAMGCCDVRDVVEAHIQAMLRPAAAGRRYLTQHVERLTYPEMAAMLADAG
jgi:nucleoside-diphosphate-sugar epimerase